MNKSKILAFFIISLMLLEVVAVNAQSLASTVPPAPAGLGQTAAQTNQTKGDFICSNVDGKVFIDSKRNITTRANIISLKGGSVCYLFGKKLLVSEKVIMNYTAPPAILTLSGKNSKLEYYGVNITNTAANITIIGSKLSGQKFGLDCVVRGNVSKCELVTSKVDLLDYLMTKLKKAIADGNLEQVRQLLQDNPDLIKKAIWSKTTTDEINKIAMAMEEESAIILRNEYEEFKATLNPNSPADKIRLRNKREEIYAKDLFLTSYYDQVDSSAMLNKEYYNAQMMKERVIWREVAIAERKYKLTGEEDPALVTKQIFERSSKYDELQQEQSFFVRNIRKLTLIGGLFSRVAFIDKNGNGINDLEELNKMEKQMGEASSEWEDAFFKKTLQGDISITRYNPSTQKFDGLDEVMLDQQKRATKYGIEKGTEILIVAASAGTGALVSKGVTTMVKMGIEKYAISEGAGVLLARYALSEGTNAVVFHTANNLLSSLSQDVPLGQLDWSVGAYVNSFLTLETYKYLGGATGKFVQKAPILTSVGGTALKSTALSLPLDMLVFSGIDMADELAKGNINNMQDFQSYAKDSFVENGIILAGLKIKEVPGMEKRVRSEKSREYTRLVEEFKNYKIEGGKLFKELYDPLDTGKEIGQTEITNFRNFLDVREKLINNQEQQIAQLRQLGELSKADYKSDLASFNLEKAALEYDKAEFEKRLETGDVPFTERDLLISNPKLLKLKDDKARAEQENLKANEIRIKNIDPDLFNFATAAATKESNDIAQMKADQTKLQNKIVADQPKVNPVIAAKELLGIPLTEAEQMEKAFSSFDKQDYVTAKGVLKKTGGNDPMLKLLIAESSYLEGKRDIQNGDIVKGTENYKEAIANFKEYLYVNKKNDISTMTAIMNLARINAELGDEKGATRDIDSLKRFSSFDESSAELMKEQIFNEPYSSRLEQSSSSDIFSLLNSEIRKGNYDSAISGLNGILYSKDSSPGMKIIAQNNLQIAERLKPLSLQEINGVELKLIQNSLENNRDVIEQYVLALRETTPQSELEIRENLRQAFEKEWVNKYAKVFREVTYEPQMRGNIRDAILDEKLIRTVQNRLDEGVSEREDIQRVGEELYGLTGNSLLSRDPKTAQESLDHFRELAKNYPDLLKADKNDLENLQLKIMDSFVGQKMYDEAIAQTRNIISTADSKTVEGRSRIETLNKNIKTYNSEKIKVSQAKELLETEKILKELASEDMDVRAEAARALSEVKLTAKTENALIQAATLDREDFVRSNAVYSLGELKSEKAFDALSNLLRDSSPEVADAAFEAIIKINEDMKNRYSSTKLYKKISSLQVAGSVYAEIAEAVDADTKGTSMILKRGAPFVILEQKKTEDELKEISEQIREVVQPSPAILDILLRYKRGMLDFSQMKEELLTALTQRGYSKELSEDLISRITFKAYLPYPSKDSANPRAEDMLLSIQNLDIVFSDQQSLSKIRDLSQKIQVGRLVGKGEYENAQAEFRAYILWKMLGNLPESTRSNRLWVSLLANGPIDAENFVKSGGTLQEVASFKKSMAEAFSEVVNRLSQNSEYSKKDLDLILHDVRGLGTAYDARLNLLSILIEKIEGKSIPALPTTNQLSNENGNPVEVKKITSTRGVPDTLYGNVVGKNLNDLFSYQISPNDPNIKGSKAVAYIDGEGDVQIAFWSKTDLIHHAEILGNLIGGMEGSELKDLNFKSSYLRYSIGEMEGFQLQYDTRSGKIIGIQTDSLITDFQANNNIAIKQSDFDRMKKAILDAIDPRLKRDGLQIDTTKKLNLVH